MTFPAASKYPDWNYQWIRTDPIANTVTESTTRHVFLHMATAPRVVTTSAGLAERGAADSTATGHAGGDSKPLAKFRAQPG